MRLNGSSAIDSIGDVPLTVMTTTHSTDAVPLATERARLDAVWDAGQARWAGMSSRSTFMRVDSGHHIEIEHPDLVAAELIELLTLVTPSTGG